MSKKDIIFTLIISEAIAWLLLLLWFNLSILSQYWSFRWALLVIIPLLTLIFLFIVERINKKISWNILRVSKFAIIGALNTFLDFGILNLLSYLTSIYFGWWMALFNTISFVVANINSFFWNRNWAFFEKNNKQEKKNEFIKFFGVSLISLVANTIVFLLMLELLRWTAVSLELPIIENLAKLIAVLFSKFVNYFGYKLFVFKTK